MRAVEELAPACREVFAAGRSRFNGKIRLVSTGDQRDALAKLERDPAYRVVVAPEPGANT